MKIVGLTGGIASGKSTVSAMLAEMARVLAPKGKLVVSVYTGYVDADCWAEIIKPPPGLASLNGEEDFQKLWEAHPHNYLDDNSQNTSSDELRDELGREVEVGGAGRVQVPTESVGHGAGGEHRQEIGGVGGRTAVASGSSTAALSHARRQRLGVHGRDAGDRGVTRRGVAGRLGQHASGTGDLVPRSECADRRADLAKGQDPGRQGDGGQQEDHRGGGAPRAGRGHRAALAGRLFLVPAHPVRHPAAPVRLLRPVRADAPHE